MATSRIFTNTHTHTYIHMTINKRYITFLSWVHMLVLGPVPRGTGWMVRVPILSLSCFYGGMIWRDHDMVTMLIPHHRWSLYVSSATQRNAYRWSFICPRCLAGQRALFILAFCRREHKTYLPMLVIKYIMSSHRTDTAQALHEQNIHTKYLTGSNTMRVSWNVYAILV